MLVVETGLYYPVAYGLSEGSERLENIIEVTSLLKEAREQTAASCCDVVVSLGLIGQEYGPCHYTVKLSAPDRVRLQDALKIFFREGGLPARIWGETRAAEELFPPYGKRLKRDFFGDVTIVDA